MTAVPAPGSYAEVRDRVAEVLAARRTAELEPGDFVSIFDTRDDADAVLAVVLPPARIVSSDLAPHATAQALIRDLQQVFAAAVEVGLVDDDDASPASWAELVDKALRAAGRLLGEYRARVDELAAELATRPPVPAEVPHIHAYDVDEDGRPQPCPCGHVHPWIVAALRRGEQPAPVVALRSVP